MGIFDEMEGSDELTPEDLEFLNAWENLGKSDTADSEYNPDVESDGESQAEEAPQGNAQLGGGENDPDAPEGDNTGNEHGDSGQVDETKMDISDFGEDQEQGDSQSKDEPDSEGDHLEDGEGDEIQDGEDELDYDPETGESLDEGDENEDFEPADDDAPGEADSHEHTQIEEDDGEGERGNSDEQRESDEPIQHNEHDNEGEADDEPEREQEIQADAEKDFEGDAQKELDDHLKENQEAEQEQKAGKTDEPPEKKKDKGEPDKSQENVYDGVPAPGEACTNHCEDNPQDDHDGECPHCSERIKRERELWGPIAKDKNGKDILPGDKVRVALPISFMVLGTVLTANVPNQAVDPRRVAESTGGEIDTSICWLSGAISQFTGWHMEGPGNPIWTFQAGKKIGFVEKIGEPIRHGQHGDNLEEGDQLDLEDHLDQKDKEQDEEIEDEESREEEEEAEEPEDEDPEEDEPESEFDEDESKRKFGDLPKHQKARFENLTTRIMKKIEGTFGGTAESIEIQKIEDHGSWVEVGAKIVSRGSTFSFGFVMRRYNEDVDGPRESDPEDEAA